ncbi:MAG: hypothetical protein ACKN9S_07030 [Pirellula sp.]
MYQRSMGLGKIERFREFLRRLEQSPPASSHDEAFKLLSKILNDVEGEFTDIPFQPNRWQTDGRLYPPEDDNARVVDSRDDLIRYRHRSHNTFIRDNGAIEIQDMDGSVLFEKRGLDGRGVDLSYGVKRNDAS